MKKLISGMVAVAFTAAAVFGVAGVASAAEPSTSASSTSTEGVHQPDVRVVESNGSHVEVSVDGELVVIDYLDDGAIITDPRGQTTRIDAAHPGETQTIPSHDAQSSQLPGIAATELQGSVALAAAKGGNFGCTLIMTAVGMIHTGGWLAAIALVAATGAAGAAILATMWMLGSAGFLAWAGSHC